MLSRRDVIEFLACRLRRALLPHLHEGLAVAIHGLRAWPGNTSESQSIAAFACFSVALLLCSGLLILGLCNEALRGLQPPSGKLVGTTENKEAIFVHKMNSCHRRRRGRPAGQTCCKRIATLGCALNAFLKLRICACLWLFLYSCWCSACLSNLRLRQVLTGRPCN